MKLSFEHPSALTTNEIFRINELATSGFGRTDPSDMLPDTRRHVANADVIQRAYDDNERMVGFTLYASCLWRACN